MKDKISSLFDNEFTDSELDSLLSDVTKNKSHQTNWSYYQITRDVLQGNYVA
jgi:negative regulator of sigma E activity